MLSFLFSCISDIINFLDSTFILPSINISYWDFVISLAIIGLGIKVFIVSIKREERAQQYSNNRQKSNKSKKGD